MFRKHIQYWLIFMLFSSIYAFSTESISATSSISNGTIPYNQSSVSVTFTVTMTGLSPTGIYELHYVLDGSWTTVSISQGGQTTYVKTITASLGAGTHEFGGALFLYNPGASQVAYFTEIYVTLSQQLRLIVKNSFDTGTTSTINVDGTTRNNAYSVYKFAGNSVGLGAIDQQFNPYYRVWNLLGIGLSNWQKQPNGQPEPTDILDATSRNYSYTVSSNDNNATLIAAMKKRYNVSRSDKTEFDGTISVSNSAQIVEQNSGTIPSPSTKTVGSNVYNFMGWENGGTGVFTPTDNQTYPYNALYKSLHKTTSSSALSSTNQRKIVRTEEGYLFIVYESMNRVWLEKSTDDGATWSLCNSAPVDNGPEAKSPSIDYLTSWDWGTDPNELFITYQQKTANGNYTIQLARFNISGQKQSDQSIYTSASSYTNNATPVLAVTWYYRDEYRKQIVGIWKEPASTGVNAGLYWYPAYYVGSTFTWNDPVTKYYQISNTNSSSTNPSIDVFKYDLDARDGRSLYYPYAWEQGGQQIKFQKVICGYSGLSITGPWPATSLSYIFMGNYHPSITSFTNTDARLCWNGYLDTPEETPPQAIMTNPNSPSTYWSYGNYVTSSSINKYFDEVNITEGYAIGWTQNSGSGYSSYSVKSTNLGSSVNLQTSGKDLQLYNGNEFASMRGISLSNSSPYAFQLSGNVQDGSLLKSSTGQISFGRTGIVSSGNAHFYFTIGDIFVNDQNINFSELSDSTKDWTDKQLLDNLISKPFTLTNVSNFTYGIQYGIVDSVNAVTALGNDNIVRFKVQLLDAKTGEIIGTFDDVKYDLTHVEKYNNLGYEVNTEGIGNREVQLRLLVTTTLHPEYSIGNIVVPSGSSALGKKGIVKTQISYKGINPVTEYSLDQNYPNPFNPATTISYALPKDGNVTIKIYDALGKEVTTLVDGYKSSGRYTVEFDASKYASGMYMYRIVSDKYTAVKKMILMK